MATANYVLLEKITVGAAGASSVTFSGIPQTGYTDLVLKASVRDSFSNPYRDLVVSFNGLTTNLSNKRLMAINPGVDPVASYTGTNGNWFFDSSNTATASTFASSEMYIPNYTSSNYKSVSVDSATENNSTSTILTLLAGLWSAAAAITSITLTPNDGGTTISQYSTFYLYGIAKLGTTPAIVPYATGGDTIMTDGTYWYHTFVSSGTFTPAKGLSCDVFIVSGGGGGGGNVAGGGGAGGAKIYSMSLTPASYAAVIGGGAAGGGSNVNGSNGSASSFNSQSPTGGGGGGKPSTAGANGGSGGGGGALSGAGGTGVSGEGFAGSTAYGTGPYYNGGGGGGSSAVGVAPTITLGGGGGAGTTFNSIVYAGGGGGSYTDTAGVVGADANKGVGAAGGGNGAVSKGTTGIQAATAASANSGSGGGGGAWETGAYVAGAAGGSGIVIVRYLV